MGKYRLIGGAHICNHPTQKVRHEIQHPDGKTATIERPVEVIHYRGQNDLVESEEDLAARWPEKFQRLTEAEKTVLDPNIKTWDANKESWEEFVARVKPQPESRVLPSAGESGGDPVPSLPTPPSSPTLATPAANSSTAQQLRKLDTMTSPALREYAQEEEIDVKDARTREEILRIIKAAILAKSAK